MGRHVDDHPVGRTGEEAADGPRFIGRRVHDLVAGGDDAAVHGVGVVDLDADDGLVAGRICAENADLGGLARGRRQGDDPSLVHDHLEPERLVERHRRGEIGAVDVGDGAADVRGAGCVAGGPARAEAPHVVLGIERGAAAGAVVFSGQLAHDAGAGLDRPGVVGVGVVDHEVGVPGPGAVLGMSQGAAVWGVGRRSDDDEVGPVAELRVVHHGTPGDNDLGLDAECSGEPVDGGGRVSVAEAHEDIGPATTGRPTFIPTAPRHRSRSVASWRSRRPPAAMR